MANRNFNRLQALSKEIKLIYCRATIAGTGAPTLVSADSLGVASISRVSAGLYDITLSDQYVKLALGEAVIRTPTAEDIKANVVSEAVASTKIIRVRCTTGAVATDPANGDQLACVFHLKNSTV